MPEESEKRANLLHLLQYYRKKLDRITERLIKLIGERDRIVLEIGKAKKSLGLGITDSRREEEVIEKARELAMKKGVDPELVEEIMKVLITHAKKIQKDS